MARFAVGGDEDGNEDRPTTRPLPKRPRVIPTPPPPKRLISASAVSNSRDRATSSSAAATQPEVRASVEVQSTDDSDSSWSDSLSDSSSDEEESSEEEEDVQPQPTPPEPAVTVSDAGREAEGPSGSVSVTLTDPDVLDCPICFEPLCSPVYQCENGHIACASCCTTMKNKCPSCCWPIGYNRCRAIEKVLESVKITCRNMPRGCMEKFSYSKKLAHEKTCTYASISCPHIGCAFASVSKFVYAHFAMKHAQSSKQFRFNEPVSLSLDKSQKHAFLQEKNMSTVFVLSRSIEAAGSFVNVACVAPPSEKRAYLYDLTATVGESSVRLKSIVDVVPKWMGQPPSKLYLVVPKDFVGSSGVMNLEVNIWRNPVTRI